MHNKTNNEKQNRNDNLRKRKRKTKLLYSKSSAQRHDSNNTTYSKEIHVFT